MSSCAREYEDEFMQMVMEQNMAKAKKEFAAKKKELEKSKRRISELDGLFKRLYEDNPYTKSGDAHLRSFFANMIYLRA